MNHRPFDIIRIGLRQALSAIVAGAILLVLVSPWAYAETKRGARSLEEMVKRYFPGPSQEELRKEINEARNFAEKQKALLGEDSLGYAGALNRLAELLLTAKEYEAALPLAEKALVTRRRLLPVDHPDVASSLSTIAALLKALRRWSQARSALERAIAIRSKTLPQDDIALASDRDALAGLLEQAGRHEGAAAHYERVLPVYEKRYGLAHTRTHQLIKRMAALYRRSGRYAAAEPLYERLLLLSEKGLDANSKWSAALLAKNYGWIAQVFEQMGRYRRAEELFKKALQINVKSLGENDASTASAANNLAVLYRRLGNFEDAERFYKRALSITESVLGRRDPRTLGTLGNLAEYYLAVGRSDLAKPLMDLALEDAESIYGSEAGEVALHLSRLALLEVDHRNFKKSEELLQRALHIARTKFGKQHPQTTNLIGQLAALYNYMGAPAEALGLYEEVLSNTKKNYGTEHPLIASTLGNIASTKSDLGEFDQAEKLHRKALALKQRTLPAGHPSIATTYNNLAALYYKLGDWQQATDYLRLGTDVIVRLTRRGAQIIGRGLTGEKKSEAILSRFVFQAFVKSAYRLVQHNEKAVARLTAETFQAAQWVAGSDAAGSLAKMAARQATRNTGLAGLVRERQDLVVEWQKRDAAHSAAVSKAEDKRNRKQEAKNVSRLSEIDRRIADIDKRLASDFPDYSALANPHPLTITDVQKHLKASEVLVLFLDTAGQKPLPEETYVWLVTKTDSRWVRSDLGPKALKDYVDALRCGLDVEGSWVGDSSLRCFDLLKIAYTEADQDAGKPLPFQLTRAFELYEGLFGQVKDLIQGKSLLIVPSGPLTQLPFQVLVTKNPEQDGLTRRAFTKASWLAKQHAITVMPSVSSLKALRAHAKTSKARKPFVGFGNPLLDGDQNNRWDRAAAKVARSIQGCAGSDAVRTAELRVARRAVLPMGRGTQLADLSQLRAATALPETADELCVVARSAGAQTGDVYLGKRATEAGLKSLSEAGQLAEHRVLHFATHGALAGELKGSAEPGLILTPPAEATEKDDGYLSASEVAGLKLDADWVILSACNTAGGDTKNAEALSGLAKAFFYAGARSLLVSHWYVDSQATVALITKAFAMLKQYPRIGRAKALQLAMLSLQVSGKRTWHPAYWAPFVVVGGGAG